MSLTEGGHDAVALNEFTGRKAVKDLELSSRVEIVQSRPLSIEGLHVLVHKTHPDAEAMLTTINSGLDKIKTNGVYQQIIDTHMWIIWSELGKGWKDAVYPALLIAFFSTSVSAECERKHKVAVGDTIFTIAEQYFQDYQKWSVIYYGNQDRLSGALLEFPVGTVLNIPCLPSNDKADATPLRQLGAEMKLLTGSNYAPFTDRGWAGDGMITEIVNAALENRPLSCSIRDYMG